MEFGVGFCNNFHSEIASKFHKYLQRNVKQHTDLTLLSRKTETVFSFKTSFKTLKKNSYPKAKKIMILKL